MGGGHAADPPYGVGSEVSSTLYGLDNALESIGTTLDERTTCQELVDYMCDLVCDAAAVDLLPKDIPSMSPVSDPDLERVATAGRADLLGSWGEGASARCPCGHWRKGIRSPLRRTRPGRGNARP